MESQRTRRFKALHYIFFGVGAMFFIIGSLFKIMHWPGGSIGVMIGALFVVFSFPVYYKLKQSEKQDEEEAAQQSYVNGFYEETEKKSKSSFSVLQTLGAVIVVTGAVFKIQHWPYGTYLLIGGIAVSAIDYLIAVIKSK